MKAVAKKTNQGILVWVDDDSSIPYGTYLYELKWLDISEAPAACHVIAAYFDYEAGEYIMDIVMSPPEAPFTKFMYLPTTEGI